MHERKSPIRREKILADLLDHDFRIVKGAMHPPPSREPADLLQFMWKAKGPIILQGYRLPDKVERIEISLQGRQNLTEKAVQRISDWSGLEFKG